MINIVVEGKSGQGINTLASHIAMLLYNKGFDVVVNSSDVINAELATKERLHKIKNTMIGVNEQLRQEMEDHRAEMNKLLDSMNFKGT